MPRSVLTTGFICGFLAVFAAVGCKRVPPPGGAQGSKPEAARKQAETLAVSAVTGAAANQAELLARAGIHFDKQGHATSTVSVKARPAQTQPTVTSGGPSSQSGVAKKGMNPRPGSPPVIKEQVVSSLPYATETEADDDALAATRDLIERRLAELDPPIRYRPSLNEVRNEFVRADTRTVFPFVPDPTQRELYEKNELGKNLVQVRYDVEITAAQIRELRTRDRLNVTLRVFGALGIAALMGFLFLRADEWTKGYLTRWLAFAAVLLAGGAAAALYFV